MGVHTIRMPDIGEGIAEAEVTEWMVALGQQVQEDDVLCTVMTDKATVEIPSAVAGKVLWLGADLGDRLAVGADLLRLEVAGEGNARAAEAGAGGDGAEASAPPVAPAAADPATRAVAAQAAAAEPPGPGGPGAAAGAPAAPVAASPAKPAAAPVAPVAIRAEGDRPLAPPSVRLRARDAGIDLRLVRGSGPAGRISHADLDGFLAGGGLPPPSGPRPDDSVEEIKVIGLRRRISENMARATAIPHITIVEEIDATALEDLRARFNAEGKGPKLSFLPFLAKALVRVIAEQPMMNVHHFPEEGLIRRYGAVNLGIATQTPTGLMVPVLRHAEAQSLRGIGAEIARLAQAARDGSAKREELSGSTITITSLGALGAIATTPILNAPEVAIIGVNKLMVRPHWNGAAFEPRKMMNLSCSFDHRVIDGWDAAIFVNRLKTLLEAPAMIFVEG